MRETTISEKRRRHALGGDVNAGCRRAGTVAALAVALVTGGAIIAPQMARAEGSPGACVPSCHGQCGPDGCGGYCRGCVDPLCTHKGCACPAGTADINGDAKLCSPIVEVALNEAHGCAITAMGTLHCWGKNTHGQLGVGSRTDRYHPVRVGKDVGWTHVAVGYTHTCGIRAGRLYCWGYRWVNYNEPDAKRDVLKPAQAGTGDQWQAVSTQSNKTCGILAGALHCWTGTGWPAQGEVAPETFVSTQVGLDSDWDAVAVASGHSCGIRAGHLYCWGSNEHGQLGDGTTTQRATPTQVGSLADWGAVALGMNTSCGVRSGDLYCWGSLIGVPLGSGAKKSNLPVPVGPSGGWSTVALRSGQACGLRDSELWCWGSNYFRQSGPSILGTIQGPTRVDDAVGWERVAAGGLYACATREGRLHCWGRLESGPLGYSQEDKRTFFRIDTSNGWSAVSVNVDHACGIRDGGAWCWGLNWWGQLGVEGEGAYPMRIGDDDDWEAITTGITFSCGIRAGYLYCWGTIDKFGLPMKVTTSMFHSPTPTLVDGSPGWSTVSAGNGPTTACGIRDGELYCWGSNTHGLLGIPTNEIDGSATPLRVGTSVGWSSPSVGFEHACGVLSGTAHCWGQLPLSAWGATSTPQAVTNDTDWVDVDAGYLQTCGTRGTALYCWGWNGYGALGIPGAGIIATPTIPVIPSGLWETVSTDVHTCGIRAGALVCWGETYPVYQPWPPDKWLYAWYGRPVQVDPESDWSHVAVSPENTCAIRAGELYCMGSEHIACTVLVHPTPVPWP